MLIGDWILLAAAAIAVVPFIVLSFEAFASLFPQRRHKLSKERPRCAVLIPAHNEEAGITATIRNVRLQLSPGDRIVIVADNCSDATAEVARRAGAEVAERCEPDRRGKGYALEFGMNHLADDPPAVVVIVDADCELGPRALEALVRQVEATSRPAQGIYELDAPRDCDPRRRLSAFAVLIKNEVRPRGLDRMGLPCLLTGTGMAFPWSALRSVHLGSGNIVEDMKLGVDLAIAGHAPQMCPSARVASAVAPDHDSTMKQRTRWEHGHVQTLLTQVPRLVAAGIFRGRPALIGLAFELAVPPLSLLALAWLTMLTLCLVWWQAFDGSWAPSLILSVGGITAGVGIFLAWAKFARRTLPMFTLVSAPLYIVWKLPIYLKLLAGREKKWVRTARSPLHSAKQA